VTVLPGSHVGFRTALRISAVTILFALAGMTGAGTASASFQEGQIVVTPDSYSVDPYTVSHAPDGTEVPLVNILDEAADAGAIDLDSFPRLMVGGRTLSRNQVMTAGPGLNVVFDPGKTTINLPGGGIAVYGQDETYSYTPKILVFSKSTDFRVTLTPNRKTVKSGREVRFRAKVTGTTGKLTYSWSFGDGSSDLQTLNPTVTHTFRGSDRSFSVVLTVTEEGNTRNGTASAVITIGKPEGKPEKSPNKPDRKPKDQPPPSGSNGGGYPAGGGSGGYPGGSYGTPAAPVVPAPAGPSVSAPPPPAAKQKPQPAAEGLVPVRGELVGPSIPGEVIDPNSRPPAADSVQKAGQKGFGLSGEAKTALGVIALLGLGGLAELRSFSRLRSD